MGSLVVVRPSENGIAGPPDFSDGLKGRLNAFIKTLEAPAMPANPFRRQITRLRIRPHAKLPKPCRIRGKNNLNAAHIKLLTLTLELSEDFDARDRPLIKKLLREYRKCYPLGLDVRDEIALCAMMLYRHMQWHDIRSLYRAKFGGGSDLACSLDIELVFGFDAEEAIGYLNNLPPKKRKPIDRDIIRTIKRYLSQRPEAVYRSRSEYLQRIEKHLMDCRREELWAIYGKALQPLLGYAGYQSTETE
ncbi:Uncharacterised protein [Kingella potus]|uniref:Uncharacterized protein n=1 Tax=Kingella potus TaxID=265175 RepID=A0A377QXQ2_9NEIS|nr:hypothetical protein [Kingella potus]UOP01709.1 hypothetical protein LVJ84_06195 [Kingella potus]STQ99983.1 Uncharacterised protein [Kingella potus]